MKNMKKLHENIKKLLFSKLVIYCIYIYIYIWGALEVSNHFWGTANFCLFIVGNLKDVDHKTMNMRHKLETQWTALSRGSRMIS